MKKNILFLNHSVRDGGPGKSLFYLLKHFDYSSYNVNVLIPSKNNFSENIEKNNLNVNQIVDKNFPENLKKPNLNMFGNSIPLFFIDILINILRLVFLSITIKDIIKDNKIDLLYCNGTQAKIFGAIIGKIYNIKTVWHVRNIQKSFLLSWFINSFSKFNNVSKIICVSKATSNQFKINTKNIVINNGVDTSEFSLRSVNSKLREEYNIDSKKIIIGTAGRIVPRKGFDYFIEVCKQISHEFKKDCIL